MIAEAALEFLGTPFHHQARVPGHGLDCVGLFVCAAKQSGVNIEDFTTYGRESDPKTLLQRLEKDFHRVDGFMMKDDVVVFWLVNKDLPQHIGIVINESSFIHAYNGAGYGKVRIDNFEGRWKKHFHSVWRLNGNTNT